jgi:hypothetical protein
MTYILAVCSPLLILYLFAPQHFPQTMDPIQPDSWVYICSGIKSSNLDDSQKINLINSLSSWVQQNVEAKTCDQGAPWFKGRILLPWLISIFANFNSVILILLPAILIYIAICYVWYQLFKKLQSKYSLFLLLAPFLSTHIGWHLALVLSDGPMILGLLLLLLWGERDSFKSSHPLIWIEVCLLINLVTITSRQSWPFLLIFNYYITRNFRINKKFQTNLIKYLLISSPIISIILLPTNNPRNPEVNLGDAIFSSLRSLFSDTWSMVKFFDIFGLIILYYLINFVYKQISSGNINFGVICFILLFFVCSLTVVAAYLSNPVFGQNWRLHLPAIMFGVYVLQKREEFKLKSH